ncbi:MAG: hypothetical protein ACREO9_03180, partial [Lysobacterales bacterium]
MNPESIQRMVEPAAAPASSSTAYVTGRRLADTAMVAALCLTLAAGCSKEQQAAPGKDPGTGIEPPAPAAAVAVVDAQRLVNADAEPGNWMSHGRTYSEQRFSPLQSITAENVSSLGLAWYFDLDTQRGQEATPLVIDGRMYVSTAWSKVKA